MESRLKKLALILLLTVFFLIDDVLFYFLLVNLYNLKIKPLLLGLVSTFVLAANASLALVVIRVLRKRPTTGPPGMIGKAGTVVKRSGRELWVKVSGELWRASATDRLRAGDAISVESVDGLVLIVKRKHDLMFQFITFVSP